MPQIMEIAMQTEVPTAARSADVLQCHSSTDDTAHIFTYLHTFFQMCLASLGF